MSDTVKEKDLDETTKTVQETEESVFEIAPKYFYKQQTKEA